MFNVVITTYSTAEYRTAMQAIDSHPFEDVMMITKKENDDKTVISVGFIGSNTRNTEAHAYFVKHDLIAHVEPV